MVVAVLSTHTSRHTYTDIPIQRSVSYSCTCLKDLARMSGGFWVFEWTGPTEEPFSLPVTTKRSKRSKPFSVRRQRRDLVQDRIHWSALRSRQSTHILRNCNDCVRERDIICLFIYEVSCYLKCVIFLWWSVSLEHFNPSPLVVNSRCATCKWGWLDFLPFCCSVHYLVGF